MTENKTEAPARERTLLYTFARCVVWLISHSFFPAVCRNRERLDRMKAPFLLISNHISWYDPLVVAYFLKKYEIRFIAKKELMSTPLTHYLLNKLHAFPVGRHEADMQAMRTSIKVLKEGHVLGIFPEGTRYSEGVMEQLETGVALLALRGNVPIVPMWIANKARLFRPIRCVIGEEIDISDLRAEGLDKAVCEKVLARITEAYARICQEGAK